MKIIQMGELDKGSGKRARVIRSIRTGKVFLYPTDTIYGLGCDAMNSGSVERIRRIKGRTTPFSVIAPSREWILENLRVSNRKELDRLPGPYTLIFEMRKRVVCREVAGKNLGVRIPDHAFTGIVQEAGVPFVTTSANVSGETPAWNVRSIPAHVEREVDCAIDDGIKRGSASRIIDLSGKMPRVLRK